jgi:acetyl-CoA carboxylase carboxyltransferase component
MLGGHASIAVMVVEPAIQAVYAGKMAEMDEATRKKFLVDKMAEYEKDIDIKRLAGELIIDHIVDYSQLRSELCARFKLYTREKNPLQPPGIMPM